MSGEQAFEQNIWKEKRKKKEESRNHSHAVESVMDVL